MRNMTRHHRWLLAVVCGLLLAGLAAGLGAATALGQDEGSDAGSGKTILRIGWMGEPDNMNPFIGWTNNVYEIFANEYLRLTEPETKDWKVGDRGVAKEWTVSDDGLHWEFILNEGLTWHDGEPLTAKDVAFTFNYIIDNEISSYIQYCEGIEEVNAPDDLTVEFVLSHPKSNLLYLWIPVLPEHIWSKLSAEEATTTFPNDPPVIGSGPFQTTEWKRGRYVKMEAYDGFYLGRPTVDEILFVLYKNPDTMVQDIKSGALDCAYLFPPAQYKPLEAEEDIEVTQYSWFNWDYMGINCYDGPSKGHPVLLDKEFRAALEYAVDRDRIVEVAYSGYAVPGFSFMPPNNWTDPDYHWEPTGDQLRAYDPETARQMLDDAGYVDSDGNGIREYKGEDIQLRLWSNADSPEAQRTGKLVAGWWEEIGLDIVLSVQDDGVYFDKIWNYDGDTYMPDFDVYVWQWDGYADPGQTLNCFTTAQIEGWNEFGWSNETFDELNQTQDSAMDLDLRADFIKQMQEVMYEDVACIVTTFPYKLQAWRTDKWTGWERALDGSGPAYLNTGNCWAYYNLQPVVAQEESGSNVGLWVGIGVACAVVLGVGIWLVARGRRGGPSMEE